MRGVSRNYFLLMVTVAWRRAVYGGRWWVWPTSVGVTPRRGEVIRDFMRAYVTRRERRAFEAEAGLQSRLLAAASRNPDSA
jgi:hypothetical protein